MKLTTFFISRTKQIYAITLTASESTFKLSAISPWELFEILLTSAVICNEMFLHRNEIAQYLQNYKYHQDVIIKAILENPYKLLQTSRKTTTLKQLIYFLQYVQFLATLYL